MIFIISEKNTIIFMFIFTELALLLVSIFSVNFGDKMQLVPKKKLPYMIIITFLVGSLYETLMFLFDPGFFDGLNFHMLMSMGVSVIASMVIKIFVFSAHNATRIAEKSILSFQKMEFLELSI